MTCVIRFILLVALATTAVRSYGQSPCDSTVAVSRKFVRQVSHKTEQYYQRITGKTEKTLRKLARWEDKIRSLLQKTAPAAEAQLFGSNQLTFRKLLEQYEAGQQWVTARQGEYFEYTDKLKGTTAYLANADSAATQLRRLKAQVQQADSAEQQARALEQFIKERRQQLIEQCVQHIGNSKYLQKINKETYYYVETMRNYRQLFSDPKKAEEMALRLLNKIPAFREFLQRNSALAGLFGLPGSNGGGVPNLAGLQTRASVQNLIQQQFGSGPNAMAALRDNVQAAQAQLQQLKDKANGILGGGSNGADGLPGFKPNNQKTKTFLQRLEFGSTLQHQRSSRFLPGSSDIALNVGYKLNDRSTAGLGISGKIGWGQNIQNFRITGEGVGLRSFVHWKLKRKGSFWLSSGAELNYQSRFYHTTALNSFNNWQPTALLGILKQYCMGKKGKGSMSILYDFLYNLQAPVRQPVVVRMGYALR